MRLPDTPEVYRFKADCCSGWFRQGHIYPLFIIKRRWWQKRGWVLIAKIGHIVWPFKTVEEFDDHWEHLTSHIEPGANPGVGVLHVYVDGYLKHVEPIGCEPSEPLEIHARQHVTTCVFDGTTGDLVGMDSRP